jgi:hypothetical protein
LRSRRFSSFLSQETPSQSAFKVPVSSLKKTKTTKTKTKTTKSSGVLSYKAPIEVDGESDSAVFEVLIEDPNDRSNLLVSAHVDLPGLFTTGTRTFLNITTTMRMIDDQAVHLFLGDLLISDSMNVWIRGETNIAAKVPVCK